MVFKGNPYKIHTHRECSNWNMLYVQPIYTMYRWAYQWIFYSEVVSFLSVAKDLANRWTDMALIYSDASYKSWCYFRRFYFCKSGYCFRLFFCPFISLQIYCPLMLEALPLVYILENLFLVMYWRAWLMYLNKNKCI